MQLLQYWLKSCVPACTWHLGCIYIKVAESWPWPLGRILICIRLVQTWGWSSERRWSQQMPPTRVGELCARAGHHLVLSQEWRGSGITNCLKMLMVFLALKTFLPDLKGHHVLVRSDNMTVVSYINHQGGFRSRPQYKLVRGPSYGYSATCTRSEWCTCRPD